MAVQDDPAYVALRKITTLHQGQPRRSGSRRLAVEMRCRECGKHSPCESWLVANRALEARR